MFGAQFKIRIDSRQQVLGTFNRMFGNYPNYKLKNEFKEEINTYLRKYRLLLKGIFLLEVCFFVCYRKQYFYIFNVAYIRDKLALRLEENERNSFLIFFK